jgi:hypothetical protein
MPRIATIAFMTVVVLPVMGSFQLVAPRDGLIMFSGKAFAADMPTKAPVAPPPAPIGKGKGKGKAPYGKGKAPIVTRG